jgi:hypothetical protein
VQAGLFVETSPRQAEANLKRVRDWQEKDITGVDGDRERLSLVLKAGTKACLHRIAEHHGKQLDYRFNRVVGTADRFRHRRTGERKTKDNIIRRALW